MGNKLLKIVSICKPRPSLLRHPVKWAKHVVISKAVPSYDGAGHMFLAIDHGDGKLEAWDCRFNQRVTSTSWTHVLRIVADNGYWPIRTWDLDLTDEQHHLIVNYLQNRRGWPNPANRYGQHIKIGIMGLVGWICGYSIDYLWMDDKRKLLPLLDKDTYHYIISCTGLVANVLRIYKSGKFQYLSDELLTTSFRYVYDMVEELNNGK